MRLSETTQYWISDVQTDKMELLVEEADACMYIHVTVKPHDGCIKEVDLAFALCDDKLPDQLRRLADALDTNRKEVV